MPKSNVMKAIPLFVLLLICGACTITKRHFGPGYHVEWKHRFSEKTPDESGSIEKTVNVYEIPVETEFPEKALDSSQFNLPASNDEVKSDSESPVTNDLTHKKSFVKSIEPLKIVRQVTHSKQAEKDHPKPKKSDSKRVDVLTWIALGLLSLLLITALIVALLKVLINPVFTIFLILAVGSLVLSSISLKRVLNSPEDYSGKALTIIVFALSVLICLGLSLYILRLDIKEISSWS